jgi:serine phosphatase RsbU (regulator of sigma subunit)
MGAVCTSLLTAAIAIPLTEDMRGPFAGFMPDDRLLLAQLLVGVISLTTLLLAAVVTERQRAEESVRYVAETLQESLLPASLPVISGMQAAVEFRPVEERGIVGGDFYEVVEQEDGSVGVAIGDALGKGAIAAADTALARYTLRAAALREREPSTILGLLNEAMLRQTPDHPCTVAYTRFELNQNGAMLTVSIAGHPKPLILRVNGAVEPIGYPTPPLGVRQDLNLTDHVAQLAPGDAVLLYTDGLTDAYAPHRVVSADDLAVALQAHGGGTATEIIEAASLAAVPPDADRSPRDDILLLVLRLEDRDGASASA